MSPLAHVVRGAIFSYRYTLSSVIGRECRFLPTCSEYACQAIDRFGVVKGGGLTIWRLLRCHPFHRGGYDPLFGETRQGAKDP